MSARHAENDAGLHGDPWMMKRVGRALDAIRHAEAEGLETALDLLAFAEDVLAQYGTSVPGCSWCPPDCRSGCTRDRDCECYAHQDEPDRHAPLPPASTDGAS